MAPSVNVRFSGKCSKGFKLNSNSPLNLIRHQNQNQLLVFCMCISFNFKWSIIVHSFHSRSRRSRKVVTGDDWLRMRWGKNCNGLWESKDSNCTFYAVRLPINYINYEVFQINHLICLAFETRAWNVKYTIKRVEKQKEKNSGPIPQLLMNMQRKFEDWLLMIHVECGIFFPYFPN